MQGSLLTLVLCNVLFLPSFALHWSRHAWKHHDLARGRDNLLDGRSVNTVDRHFMARAGATTVDTIRERRLSNIIGGLSNSQANFSSWVSSLDQNGKWPDSEVDYTTGCSARRANWPAQDHWLRVLLMSAAWHGGLPGADKYVKDKALLTAISGAIDYWYSRDFTNQACLSQLEHRAVPATIRATSFGILTGSPTSS